MSFGEVGVVAPSILCQINVLTYYVRVMNMENDRIAKIVFNELVRLNDVGFNTWVSSARDISHKYGIDIDCCENTSAYLKNIKATVTDYYQKHWFQSVNNVTENPLLRTYRLFKHIFRIEPYLLHVKNDKHRKALSKFRCSSHFLEIERARHKNPIPPVNDRLCPICNVIDDEIHLMLFCKANQSIRNRFLSCLNGLYPVLKEMQPRQQFCLIMAKEDENLLCILAKFIYDSFEIRGRILSEL